MDTSIIENNRRAALFDLDGVLIDSESSYTAFWDEIGKRFQLPSPTFAYDIKGCTLKDILDRHFPEKDKREELTHLIHSFEESMEYPIFDGVEPLLQILKLNGWKTAVVTSSDAVKMSHLNDKLPGFLNKFDVVVNGSMVKRSKPNPEGYLTAARLLGCNINECVVFEDSLQGLEAGRRSGAKTIALATTNPRNILTGKADYIFDSIAEVVGNQSWW